MIFVDPAPNGGGLGPNYLAFNGACRAQSSAVASIESHLDSDDQDLVKDARKDLLRYVTAGDPPQIKMEARRRHYPVLAVCLVGWR